MSRTSKPRVAASDGMAISRASGRTRRRDFMGTPGIAVQHGFFLPHREGICLSASHSRGRACPREGGGRDGDGFCLGRKKAHPHPTLPLKGRASKLLHRPGLDITQRVLPRPAAIQQPAEIGRESGRERVCQSGSISVVPVPLKKKKNKK